MKYLFNFIALFLTIGLFSQSWTESIAMSGGIPPAKNINGTDSYQGLVGNELEWSKISGMLAQFDDVDLEKRNIKGSIYLFETWDNKGEIFVGQKKYVINNINFHLEKEVFMSQLGKDSTLIYEKNKFNKVLVNGRIFKYLDVPNDNITKAHEIIYEGKNLSLFKSFSATFIERSKNPMVNRPESVIKHKSKYYILKNKQLVFFKPNKRNMKDLLDKDKFKDLKLYLKQYNLSFRKDEDLKIIFKYCDNL
jgi:hypothetical protein